MIVTMSLRGRIMERLLLLYVSFNGSLSNVSVYATKHTIDGLRHFEVLCYGTVPEHLIRAAQDRGSMQPQIHIGMNPSTSVSLPHLPSILNSHTSYHHPNLYLLPDGGVIGRFLPSQNPKAHERAEAERWAGWAGKILLRPMVLGISSEVPTIPKFRYHNSNREQEGGRFSGAKRQTINVALI